MQGDGIGGDEHGRGRAHGDKLGVFSGVGVRLHAATTANFQTLAQSTYDPPVRLGLHDVVHVSMCSVHEVVLKK